MDNYSGLYKPALDNPSENTGYTNGWTIRDYTWTLNGKQIVAKGSGQLAIISYGSMFVISTYPCHDAHLLPTKSILQRFRR